MSRKPILAAALLVAGSWSSPGHAQPAQREQPQRIGQGTFGSWTAATHTENGQKVCYAFARAARSENAPGNRGAVTLTVTHRPAGRDQVAVSVGYPYPRASEAVLTIGSNEFR